MKVKLIVAALLFCFCMGISFNSSADEAKFGIKGSDTIKNVLEGYTGKMVIVRLNSGAELQGIVTKVGNVVVHLSKISTRDYYDAVVKIDTISAVLVKVRNK